MTAKVRHSLTCLQKTSKKIYDWICEDIGSISMLAEVLEEDVDELVEKAQEDIDEWVY